jgi:hypothetical protein
VSVGHLQVGRATCAYVGAEDFGTGRLVNFDPVVRLAGTAERIELQPIVSKPRIPRPGDQVLLLANPQQPGTYLYAGTA